MRCPAPPRGRREPPRRGGRPRSPGPASSARPRGSIRRAERDGEAVAARGGAGFGRRRLCAELRERPCGAHPLRSGNGPAGAAGVPAQVSCGAGSGAAEAGAAAAARCSFVGSRWVCGGKRQAWAARAGGALLTAAACGAGRGQKLVAPPPATTVLPLRGDRRAERPAGVRCDGGLSGGRRWCPN